MSPSHTDSTGTATAGRGEHHRRKWSSLADRLASWGPNKPWVRRLLALAGVVILAACILFALRPKAGAEIVIIRPHQGGRIHKAIPGRSVLLKAIVRTKPGTLLSHAWDFGDGTEPTTTNVRDYYNLGASHTYKDAKAGDRFTASLTVTNRETGGKAKKRYRIQFVEPTETHRKEVAINDGLWAIHVAAKRKDTPIDGQIGWWDDKYWVGVTAMNVLAMELMGYDLSGDEWANPYVEDVRRGLNRFVQALSPHKIAEQKPKGSGRRKKTAPQYEISDQKSKNPDTNGNGNGLCVSGRQKEMYETPIVLMAFAGSRGPRRKAVAAHESVIGMTYRDIVTDLVDYFAWAQNEQGRGRGGWRYTANYRDSDMSATQWPVLGFMAAEKAMKVHAPPWVKTELRQYLKTVQGKDGGFGYQSPGSSVGLTAAGMMCLHYCGVPPDDARVANAVKVIAKNWKSDNIGSLYAMYNVMKAAMVGEEPISKFGDHDWRAEYTKHLLGRQQANGLWRTDRYITNPTFATSLAIMILGEKFLPPRAFPWWILPLIILIVAAVLGRTLLAIWWRKWLTRRAMRSAASDEDEKRGHGGVLSQWWRRRRARTTEAPTSDGDASEGGDGHSPQWWQQHGDGADGGASEDT